MKALRIKLSSSDDVKLFEKIIQKYPFDIFLRSGSYLVDAKSILGLFSLDLSRPIHMEIHESDCDSLIEELMPFCV
ncbi:MAG: HPr family phosphocarrier protein [Clostridia bacterium]|nr:HPr family phosphocarrier protein [Clostridia bacterium]MBR7135858.1 HPr family phosphocarrier protein [Clostridia bacterium]